MAQGKFSGKAREVFVVLQESQAVLVMMLGTSLVIEVSSGKYLHFC